jgi:hypothetical protein
MVLYRSPERDLGKEESGQQSQGHQDGAEEERPFDADRQASPGLRSAPGARALAAALRFCQSLVLARSSRRCVDGHETMLVCDAVGGSARQGCWASFD